MNSALKTRRNTLTYALAILLFSALYAMAFAVGTGTGAAGVITDAVVFWVVYGLQGVVLWDILRYALPQRTGFARGLVIAMTGIIITCFSVGAETIAAYALSEEGFTHFALSIPARTLTVLLSYAFITIVYLNDIAKSAAKEQTYVKPAAETPNHTNSTETIGRITLRAGQKIKIIDLDEIEYFKAEGDYVAIVTAEGRWLKEWTMKYLEENLPHDTFVRIHRSYIVGMQNITRIERVGKLYQVILRNGEEVRVSPTGYKLLKEKMKL